jgi:hypothetical protein
MRKILEEEGGGITIYLVIDNYFYMFLWGAKQTKIKISNHSILLPLAPRKK